MKKNIYFLGLGLVLSFSFFGFIGIALAGDYGLGATAGAAGLTGAAGGEDVPTILGNVIGTALSVVSIVFFILMIYGGFLWMTAHGKKEQTTKALDTIVAAVVGIIIILGAYALTQFVFNNLAGGGGGGAAVGGGGAVPVQQGGGGVLGAACQADGNCNAGMTCQGGVCAFPAANLDGGGQQGNGPNGDDLGDEVDCIDNSDCAAGAVCQNNECVQDPNAGQGVRPFMEDCDNNNQCAQGLECSGGLCKTSNGGACVNNIDCASGSCNQDNPDQMICG